MARHLRIILIFLLTSEWAAAQVNADSLSIDTVVSAEHKNGDYRFGYKKLIIPGVCLLYGVASLKIDFLKDLNTSTNDEIQEHKPKHVIWDNFSQYAPAAMVYGLNFAGVKGKHNFRDRSIIYLTSQIIMGAIVFPTKYLVKERRPDGGDTKSFPSGHTATAFSSAQFLFREYKDTNLWLGLSGYPLAAFTGVYRVVNNRHWVGDVVAGAGVGIFSTEFAYWLYPKINHLLVGKKSKSQIVLSPSYQQGNLGMTFAANF
ncbi:MAG: PA-phosphatase [Bacteroidales bacterium 45-6]|nr:MAG: PA-phosphatase [Bacteroidales bacterium 45-6]